MLSNNPKRRASNGLALAEENKKPRQDEESSEKIPQEPAVEICQAGSSGSNDLGYIQIIVAGPEKCGKSCLVLSYMEQLFPPKRAQYLSKQYLKLREGNSPVMIWDLDARKEITEYRKKSYPEADVALLCFPVKKPKYLDHHSFRAWHNTAYMENNGLEILLEPWYLELDRLCNKNMKIILVGLKRDLRNRENECFAPFRITHLRNKWEQRIVEYREVSALRNRDEARELFEYAISEAIHPPLSKTMFA